MNNLTFLMLLEIIIFGFNCLISIVLYIANRTPIFKLMLVFWVATTMQFIAFGLVQTLTDNLVIEALIGNGIILLWINRTILEILYQISDLKFRSRRYYQITVSGLLLALIGAIIGFDFPVVATISTFSICLPTIYHILRVFRQTKNQSYLINMFSIVYIFALLHLMDYPFLRLVEWFAPYGFTIHTAIHVGLAVILPSLLIKENLTKYNAELLVRENELRVKDFIIRSASSAIVTANLDAKITYVNPAFLIKWGFDNPGEVINRSFGEFWMVSDGMKEIIATLKGEEKKWSGEIQAKKKDGSLFYVHVSAATVFDDKGTPIALMSTSIDITERKQAEEELNKYHFQLEDMVTQRTAELAKAKDVAETANQAKSAFLANMSHELRTPLNAVLGFSDVLFHQEQDLQKKNQLKSIRTSGKSLLSLINDVLDLSKIEAGKLELQYSAVSMQNLFNEMSTIFQNRINDKGLEFEVQVDTNLPESLLLDETRLRQVLINLVGNAVKFTDEGFIRLSCRRLDIDHSIKSFVSLMIQVEDSGKGIPAEDQQRIFNAFDQVSGQKTAEYGGSGLGLAITKNMVQLMDGSLSLMSEPGQGSTFNIELKDVEITVKKAGGKENGREFDPDEIKFVSAKVLIVDDIDYNRNVLATYLALSNLTLYFAKNGKIAVEQTQKYQPNLILMDMKMPVMDGYEASKLLKSENSTQDIPIIAVTASALAQDEETIRQFCDGYLRKPVSQIVLINEIRRFLKHTIKKKEVPKPVVASEMSMPPEKALHDLHEIALDGNMDGIMTYLDELEQKDSKLKVFCNRIRLLAFDFKDAEIVNLLKEYMLQQSENS